MGEKSVSEKLVEAESLGEVSVAEKNIGETCTPEESKSLWVKNVTRLCVKSLWVKVSGRKVCG